MIIAAGIILFYLIIRTITVLYNFTIQPFLLNLIPENKAKVSILIPARNEEKNIKRLLEKLQKQNYPHFEVLVYDDQSEDGTAKIVKHFEDTDQRFRLLNGSELPEGWLGKNHACHNLAMNSTGDFLLFLDADVEPSENLVGNSVGYMQQKKLSLLSIFPRQIKHSAGEQLVVPLMYDILLSLLPLAFVRKSKRYTFSGANGQFMLFERNTYMEHQPHWWKRDEAVEDIAIMQYFKKLDIPCTTLLGGENVACRMYDSGKNAIIGFSKNILRFFSNSTAFVLFHLLATSFGLILMLLMPHTGWFSMYLICILVYKAIIGRLSNESVLKSWLLILPRHIMFIVVLFNAFKYKSAQNYTWKGRKVKV